MTAKRTQGERIARLEANDSIDHRRLGKLEKNMIPIEDFKNLETLVKEIHERTLRDDGAKRAYRAIAGLCVSLASVAVTIWSKGKFW